MSPRAFFRSISRGEVPSMVLFINCKGGLWKRAITRLRQELLGEQWGMHYAEFEGKEATVDELSSRLLTTPFLGTRRMVVVKEAEELWKGLGKNRDHLIRFLSSYQGNNLLVLAADGDMELMTPSRKTNPLASLVASKGLVVTMKPKTREELRQWIERELERAGLEKDPAFVDWLVEESGGNVGFVENEVEKRLLTMGEEGSLSTTASIGQFKRALSKGEIKAIESLEQLLSQGNPPLYIMGILTNLVRNAATVYEEAKRERSLEKGFQKARVYRSEKEAIFNLLKRRPKGAIYKAFPVLQRADRELKSSSTPPRIVLQQVILHFLWP